MSAAKRRSVVVDGSNIATEGRTIPSLSQLDEAVAAFEAEFKGVEIIVVVDASFEHRVAAAERGKVREAEAQGRLVTPPAGTVGRGDAFLLKIAERSKGAVLSNDSFQEFHAEHKWLFDEGRLIGGKPVRGVGWIFADRQPVRATRTKPTTTVKKADPVKKAEVAKAPAKAAPAKKADAAKVPAKKAGPSKVAQAAKKTAKVAKTRPATPATEALRRARKPVNSEEAYGLFRSTYRIGARVEGTVKTFTSHGAVVTVTLKSGSTFECYAPTASLATPPPSRARDVLARGDVRSFKLLNVDPERRIAEVGLP